MVRLLWKNRKRGAAMVEYVLMVALIAIALVFAITLLQGQMGVTFDTIREALQ